MRKDTSRAMALILAAMFLFPLAGAGFAQEKATGERAKSVEAEKKEGPVIVYRVNFEIRELEDGKRVNTRKYTLLMEEGHTGRVRVEGGVPARLPAGGIRLVDSGLDIDCHLRERGNYIALQITLELRTFVLAERENQAQRHPMSRKIRSQVGTAILPGQPTVVSVVDDTATKRRYELEVTATKVN